MTPETDRSIRFWAAAFACSIVGLAIGTNIVGDKMPAKIKIEFCTSCGSQEIKVTGNNYYCPDCDVTFKVTTQGTKVIDSNPLGKENARIDQLEDDVAELKGKQGPGQEQPTKPAEPAEPAPGGEDAEGSEQDGFITVEA